jgi:hypothetical protein
MSFLQPWALLALLAVAAPVLIHLWGRPRAVPRRFATIEFLRRSQQDAARRLRIRQAILLALRISVFVLLPLAVALPILECGPRGTTSVGDRLPASVVVVVDASASNQRGSSDEGLRQAVQRVVGRLRAWDQVAIVVAGPRAESLLPDWTDRHGVALEAFRRAELPPGRSDVERAFALARDLQAGSRQPVRRTVWVTDAAPGSDVRTLDPALAEGVGLLEVLDPWEGRRTNRAVMALRAVPADDAPPGAWVIEADVGAWGEADEVACTVTFLVDGAEAGAQTVSVPAGQTALATLQVSLAPGVPHRLEARVEDPGGAWADNVRTAQVQAEAGLAILLVNGDARSAAYSDELFFVERALGAALDDRAGATTRTTTTDRLQPADLAEVDVVVLANVAALPRPTVDALVRFAEEGGGVLLSLGDNVVVERWNQVFGPLLPKPLRTLVRLTEAQDPDAAIKATRLGQVDLRHPIFRVFQLPGGETLQGALVYGYGLVEPAAVEGARVVASYGDGGPALLERRIGSGQVLLWTSTLDADWTNLPFRTAYVPLLLRIMEHLARRSAEGAREVETGWVHHLEAPVPGVERLVVTAPDGTRAVLLVDEDGADWVPRQVGPHTVVAEGGTGSAALASWTVQGVVPRTESDTTPLPAGTLEALVERAARSAAPREDELDIPAGARSLWPWLLFAALCALYAESAVGFRRRLWRTLARKA